MNFSMDNSTAVILPGSSGALSDELTLTDVEGGGVVIEDIQKDSPVARVGTLKKGDQLNAVTIHFDNLNSEEVSKILKYSEPYKMSLKLNAKEELRSPVFRYRSPDMGLGDQAYLKLYNSKIKPHLKLAKPNMSIDGLDVGVNGKNKMPSIDINGPRISSPDIDTNLKTAMKTSSFDINGPHGLNTKLMKPELTIPSLHNTSPTVRGPGVDLDGKIKMADVKASVPKIAGGMMASDIDIKSPKGIVDVKTPDKEFKGPSFGMPTSKMKKDINAPRIEVKSPKGGFDVNMVNADLKAPKFAIPSANLHGPNLSVPDSDLVLKAPNVKDVDLNLPTPKIDLAGPKIQADVKSPSLDINAPKVDGFDAEGKLRFPKFKKPTFSISGHKPKVPEMDVSVPDMKTDIKAPDINMEGLKGVEAPETKAKFKMPSLHTPSFGLSGPKGPDVDFDGSVKAPGVDVSVPNVKGNYEMPNVGIKLPKGDIDANIPGAELNKRKFTMPKFNLPSAKLPTPDTNLNLEAPTVTSDVDAKWKIPKLKKPNLEISGIEGPNVNLGGNVKIPKADISAPEIKAGIGSAGLNLKKPMIGADYDMPDMNLEVPDVKVKGPGLKKPSLNMSPGNVSIPDVDLNLPTPRIDLDAPKIQADVKSPSLDINTPKVGDFGAEGKFRIPKFKKPTFSISGHKPKVPDLDVSVPELKTCIKAPDVDIEDIKGGVDVPETKAKAKFKVPSLHMPSFGLSGPSGPDVDFDGSIKAPGIDVSVPNVKGNYETPNAGIKLPKGDTDANIPDAELTGGKFKLPGFNMPSGKLSLSGPDKGLNMPKGQTDLSAPDLQGDIQGPSLDMKAPSIDVNAPNVDVPETKAKFKMPSLKMPSFGLSGPKGPDVDFDGSVKAPGVDVSVPNVKGNYETPNVGIKLPKGDIDANIPDAELTRGKLKLPGFNWPSNKFSLSGPDKGLNMPKGQIDLSAPDLQGDIRGPSLDMKAPSIDINAPSVDVPETKAKFKMPSLKMPSFGLSGSKGPDVDFDGSVKAPGVDVSVPNVKGNYETPDFGIKLPKGDIDANIPDAEFNKRKFTMPKFNLPSAKLSTPDTNLNLEAPTVTSDVDAKWKIPKFKKPNLEISGIEGPNVNLGGNVKIPKADLSAPEINAGIGSAGINLKKPMLAADNDMPDMNLEVPDVKLKGRGLKKPSLNMSPGNVSIPDVDLNLPTPNIDLAAPKIQADVNSPNLALQKTNVDVNTPKVDGFGAEGRFKFPKFKKPTFSISGHKPKVPDLDVSVPELKTGIKAPDVDIEGIKGGVDIPETKAKFKVPSLHMPSFGLSGPSGPDVDFDGSVKAPGVDVSVPNVKGNYETPNVGIKLPKGDIDANIPDAELTGGNFKLPGFNWPSNKLSLSGPDKGLSMPKGQIDLSAPDLQGDIRGPSLDMKAPSIDVNAPSVGVPETKAKFKMPKLELPSFQMSGPKGPDVDFDGSVKSPGVDMSVPNVKGKYETPNVGIKLPKGDIDANIPDAEFNKQKFTMPKFNLPSAKLSTPDTNLNLEAPTVTSDVDAKLKIPKFKKPNLEISGIEGPNVNLGGNVKIPKADISAPEINAGIRSAGINLKKPMLAADYDMPDMNLEVPDVKLKGRGLKKPSLNMSPGNVSIPDVDLNLPTPNIDLAAPKIQADIKSPNLALQKPNIDVNTPKVDGFGAEGRFKFPKFKKPTFSISGHKPKVPDLDVSVPELKTGIKAPDVDIEGIKGGVDVPETKAKFKVPSLHMPSFGLSGPSGPDVDFDGSVKAPGVDGSVPNVKGNYEMPNVGIKLPKGDIDANIPDAELTGGKLKLPGFNLPSGKLSLSGPDKGLNMPKGQIDLSAPDLQGDFQGPSLDMKAPSIGINAPNVDVPETKAKFKVPSLHMPSFGLSGPKGPDVDFDGSVKSPGVDVSVPNVKGDYETPNVGIKLPKGDIDANIPEAKFNKEKFTMPSLNLPSANLSTPGLNLKAPTVTSDVDAKLKIPKLKKPNLEISGIEGSNVSLGGNVKIPKADISAPEIKAGIGSTGIDLKKPMIGAAYDVPDMNLEVTNVKVKGPGLKKPALNMSPGNVSIPDVDLNLRKANIRDAGINMPDAVFQEKKLKGPNIGMKGAEFDVNSPNLNDGFREVGVDVSAPNPYAQTNAPKLNASSDQNVNMQNKFSRETFKVRSSSVSDLDDATAIAKNDLNLQARTSSTLNVTDTAMSKKSKFKFPKLFNFNHKSRGSVDFTKAQVAASSGTFTSMFPELELSVSKD